MKKNKFQSKENNSGAACTGNDNHVIAGESDNC